MHQTLHQNDVDHEVHHRIVELYSSATDVRPGGRRHRDQAPGVVARARWTLGRHLVSIGETLAGTHTSHA